MAVLLLTVIGTILAIVFRVLFMLAINFDCRARNLKATTLFTILSFFFPLITGIVYACVRKEAEPNTKYCAACGLRVDGSAKICPSCNTPSLLPLPNENAKQLAKTSITLFIISVIVVVLSVGVSAAQTVMSVKNGVEVAEKYGGSDFAKRIEDYVRDEVEDALDDELGESEENEETTDAEETTEDIDSILGNLTYYDREGNAYDKAEDVKFFDKDGNVYQFITNADLSTYFLDTQTEEKLESKKCFVDKDGYFVYDEKGEITFDGDMFTATDKDGNKYCPASLAVWNKNGELIMTLE